MSVISDRTSEAEADAGREGVTISDHVAAGATGQEASVTVDTAATIERLSVRIYPGPQLALRLKPVVRTRGNRDQPLLQYSGKSYVDGDDDLYVWELAEPIEDGEEIVVKATNTDGSNAYDYRVNADLDYEGGVGRAASSFLGGIL